jgi:hypothetical protein
MRGTKLLFSELFDVGRRNSHFGIRCVNEFVLNEIQLGIRGLLVPFIGAKTTPNNYQSYTLQVPQNLISTNAISG